MRRPGWIRQRPQHIKNRANAKLLSHGRDMLHRRVHQRREAEADANACVTGNDSAARRLRIRNATAATDGTSSSSHRNLRLRWEPPTADPACLMQ